MAALSGLYGSVVITAVGTVPGTAAVIGINEWEINIGDNVVETTAFGDTWKKFIPGLMEYDGSFSGRADTDSSNATIRNALLGGSVITLRLYDATSNYWTAGTVILKTGKPKISVDGIGERSWDFQGSDALIYT